MGASDSCLHSRLTEQVPKDKAMAIVLPIVLPEFEVGITLIDREIIELKL